LDVAGHRQAAVLVGLEPGRGVLLTRRAADLSHHAGQVAFPGGKIEVGETEEGAALREAFEEVGLVRGDVEVLGRMDDYVTGTGFHVAPVVGLLREGVELTLAAAEVAAVFYLPFEVLLDVGAAVRRKATFKGATREFWVWPHEAYFIWGATAEILVGLARRLRGEA
jgi:mutator protein MutT